MPWAPSQYPKRRLSVRSRKVSKPRDLYLELSDRSEIWQALWQQCCRCARQISKQYDNLKYQSRGFETLRDLTKRRLFWYWDGAQVETIVDCFNQFMASWAGPYRPYYHGTSPGSKVCGANMGPIWGWQDPGGPHVCPMNFAIWGSVCVNQMAMCMPLYKISHSNNMALQ